MTGPNEDRYSPSSPAGQIESIGSFAAGLTHLTGWRRQLARWSVVAVMTIPFIVVVIAHLAR
jgi:hypothetical protein